MVIWLGAWRVNGNLSVSRAIGDAKDKKFITAVADTVSPTVHSGSFMCISLTKWGSF